MELYTVQKNIVILQSDTDSDLSDLIVFVLLYNTQLQEVEIERVSLYYHKPFYCFKMFLKMASHKSYT